jgi:hypothetical protein
VRIFTTLFLSLFVAFAFAACEGDSADSPEDSVQQPSGGRGPQPSSFQHLEGQLPADFPKFFPLYSRAEIARGDTLQDSFAVDLRTGDDYQDVVDYYREALSSDSWQVTDETPAKNSVKFTFSSDDGVYEGELGVGKLSDRTWILIAMTRPE